MRYAPYTEFSQILPDLFFFCLKDCIQKLPVQLSTVTVIAFFAVAASFTLCCSQAGHGVVRIEKITLQSSIRALSASFMKAWAMSSAAA